MPSLVLERFKARLAVKQANNKPRAEELRGILIGMVERGNEGKLPLSEDQRQRMVEILRRTQPIPVEDHEWNYRELHDSAKGQFKALAVANEGREFPSVGTLVGILGTGLSDVKLER